MLEAPRHHPAENLNPERLLSAHEQDGQLSGIYICLRVEEASVLKVLEKASRDLGSQRESWHLTLRFIGQMPSEQLPDLAEALAQTALNHHCLEMGLYKRGSFPGVLWYGVQATPKLRALQEEIDKKVVDLGLPAAEYEYNPHITLGRSKSKSLEDLEASNQPPSWLPTWLAEDFEIRQSKLNEDGANCLYRFRLREKEDPT